MQFKGCTNQFPSFVGPKLDPAKDCVREVIWPQKPILDYKMKKKQINDDGNRKKSPTCFHTFVPLR